MKKILATTIAIIIGIMFSVLTAPRVMTQAEEDEAIHAYMMEHGQLANHRSVSNFDGDAEIFIEEVLV
jgi:hypothetical protein